MTLYAKELSAKLLSGYTSYLCEEDENDNFRLTQVENAEIESLNVKVCVEWQQKTIGIIDYGIEITVHYIVNNRSIVLKTHTELQFDDDIYELLYSALVDEIHRLQNPDEQDLEDDEKEM